MSYSLMILDNQDNEVFERPVGSAWATSYNWRLLAPNEPIQFVDKLFAISEGEEACFLSGKNLLEFQQDLKTVIDAKLATYQYGENYKYDLLIDLNNFLQDNQANIHNYRLRFF